MYSIYLKIKEGGITMGVLYEAIQNVPENNDVIPESCLSFYEQAIYVVDFAMNENAEFQKRFGDAELRMYKDHGILVEYVGEDADILQEAVKEKAAKMVGAMKAAFGRINQYFVAATNSGEKLVSQITPEMINSCPDNLGKTHTFFDYSKVNFTANALKFGKKVDAAFKNKKNLSQEESMEIDKTVSKNIFKDIVGVEATNIKEMKNKLRAELIGSEVDVNKAWVKKNFNKMKELVAGSKIPSEVKQNIRDREKLLDDMFATCYSHDGEEGYTNTFLGWEDALAGACQICFVGYSIVFDVYKRMHREYMNILYKVSRSKKAVKESLVPDSTIEDKDLVDQADPKEKLVPDSVVKEAPDVSTVEECGDVNDVAARHGEVAEEPAEESEGKPVSEAPDVSTVEEKCDKDVYDDKAAREGKECKDGAEESQGKSVKESASFTRQHALINSLFDF